MKYRYPDALIIIFAKTPVPGKVKTRLGLEPKLSAKIYSELLTRVVAMACNSNVAPVEICLEGDKKHPFIEKLRQTYNFRITTQLGSDMGDRMSLAFKKALLSHKQVLLLGSDCLEINQFDLKQTMDILYQQQTCCVIQPAVDGGYVLVGKNTFLQNMFTGISWSTERVLKQTLAKLKQAKTKYFILRAVSDIDTLDDLKRQLPKIQY